MIQRIQTVYLLLASILIVLPVLLNVGWASVSANGELYELNSLSVTMETTDSVQKLKDVFPLTGALIMALFLSTYSIAQFKNRKFQIKLTQGAILTMLVFVALLSFYIAGLQDLVEGGETKLSPFLIIPILVLALLGLAVRGIKKDDELVRAADRLR
jgi:hypothetical protein